jgi:hypothetical protein
MRLTFFLSLLLLIAGCATSYVPPTTGGKTVDYVQIKDDRFGWAGLYLGMTRQEAERQLGMTLTPVPDGYPGCGNWSSELQLQERKVILQWSSNEPAATIETVQASLPANELNTSHQSMADTLVKRFSGLKLLSSDEDSAELITTGNSRQVILVKNNREHFLLVTYNACMD